MPTLLVVHHSPTRCCALTDAVVAGAHDEAIEGVEVVVRPALEATADDVLAADGYLLGTTANFGYMSGALKHFFDTIFLEAGGALADDGSAGAAGGRQEAVRAVGARPLRHDGRGPLGAVDRRALPWTQAAEVLEVLGDVAEPHARRRTSSAATLAALLEPTERSPDAAAGTIAGWSAPPRRTACRSRRPRSRSPSWRPSRWRSRLRRGPPAPDVDPARWTRWRPPELGACRDLDARGRRPAEQRHQDRRLRERAHGRDLRRRRAARRAGGRGVRREELGAFAYETCSDASSRSSSAPTRAWSMRTVRQLGVVPPVGEGLGQGRAVVPLRRRRRRRGERGLVALPGHAEGLLARSPATTSGWSAPTGRPWRLGQGALRPAARLARGDHDQGRRARATPTPATGSSR